MTIYELLNKIFTSTNIKKYRDYNELLQQGKELDETEQKIYKLIIKIISLHCDKNKESNVFTPAYINHEDGSRSFAVEDITDDEYIILKKLDTSKLPLAIRARVSDLLWDTKKDFEFAWVAIESYREIFIDDFDVNKWTTCVDVITRAVVIAAQLGKNNNDLLKDTCDLIVDKLNELDGEDPLFLSIKLIELLYKQKYRDYSSYINLIDKIIQNAKKSDNVHKVENAYKLKCKLYIWGKQEEQVKITNIEFANYYEDLANEAYGKEFHRISSSIHYLQRAVSLYRNNGEPKEAERTHKKLIDIQREIPQAMKPINFNIDLEPLYNSILENFEGLSFKEVILRIVQCTPFYRYEEIKKRVLEDQKNYLSLNLFSNVVIDENGLAIINIQPLDMENPEKDPKLLEMHMHRKLLEYETLEGNTTLSICIHLLNKKYGFNKNDLLFLVDNNPIIPDGREEIFCNALNLGLHGKFYEAIHILAPQVENLFRELAKLLGGITVTLEGDNTSKTKTLTSVFDIEELKECYDPNILFIFEGLLNEKSGANIRNRIAHGIMSPSQGNSGVVIYFLCAVLRLCTYTSLECIDIYSKSERLKTFHQPEFDGDKTIILE